MIGTEWLKRLNEAMNYLEEHLEGGIDPARLSQIACCPVFHFQRMFSYIVGVKEHHDIHVEENFAQIPLFWQKTFQSGAFAQVCAMQNQEPAGVLGLSTCMNGKDFDYHIAVASDKAAPEGMCETVVPACTWAIFTCIGALPKSIQELQRRVVGEWLPASGYEYANAPDIEVFFEGNRQADDYRCEVWLPVEKR